VTATNDGTYPYVWNNSLVDASFGITSKIVLDQLKPSGELINSLEVPNSSDRVPLTKDQMVTSFPSKSEIGLNLSTDGRVVTFMGYLAPVDALDVSNSNTAAVVDPTTPFLEAITAWSQKWTNMAGFASRKPMPIVATTDAPRS
jgi:hypothetical protein